MQYKFVPIDRQLSSILFFLRSKAFVSNFISISEIKFSFKLPHFFASQMEGREGAGRKIYILLQNYIRKLCIYINTRFNRASVTNGKKKLTRVTIINNVKIIKISLENYMYYYEILYVYCINYIRKLCTYKYRARFKQAESLESRNEIQNRGYGVEKSKAADYVM